MGYITSYQRDKAQDDALEQSYAIEALEAKGYEYGDAMRRVMQGQRREPMPEQSRRIHKYLKDKCNETGMDMFGRYADERANAAYQLALDLVEYAGRGELASFENGKIETVYMQERKAIAAGGK